MALVGRSCVDRWEASTVAVDEAGERPHSPYEPTEGQRVRAVSRPGVAPQGYVSAVDARAACREAGKRLCRVDEWRAACEGPEHLAWGYASERDPGRCNDRGQSGILKLHGRAAFSSFSAMNDPAVNQQPGTLAETGARDGCTNGYGVFDMVGNLHEWTDDGTFHGGYYLDVTQNGRGCAYVTSAHQASYHDYSTGFRCCRDAVLEPARTSSSPPPSPERPRAQKRTPTP